MVQCLRSYAVTSLEQKCREMVGKEVGEGEVRSGINRHQGAAVERVHDAHAILIFVACGREVKMPPKRKKPRRCGAEGRKRRVPTTSWARRGYPRTMTTG